MPLMMIENIEKYVGDRLLFKQEGRWAIEKNDRIGIVGANGAGKSTLLAILAGRLESDGGRIVRSCSVAELEQAAGSRGKRNKGTGLDEVDEAVTGESLKRWKVPDREAAAEHGSGGEKTRRGLALLIGSGAELLIADEPTSHLDADGSRLLKEALDSYDGAVVLVSHDRALLNAVCNGIVEMDEGKLTLYEGNYADYKKEKEARLARTQFEYEQYAREKERLEAAIVDKKEQSRSVKKKPSRTSHKEARLGIMKRQGAKAKLDRAASALEERLNRLEVKQKSRDAESPLFDAEAHEPCRSKHVIRLEELTAGFGERALFERLRLSVKPGMRIALVGANGAGKTTLLRMIDGRADGIVYSPSCRIGYFRQDLSLLDESKSILHNVSITSNYDETHIRTVLARTLFKRDDVFKLVVDLSGGERIKATLTKLFLGFYNTLLLDEPTNYLDIFARESLEEALVQYPGTIIFASHDESFVRRVATHRLLLSVDGWRFCGIGAESAAESAESASTEPEQELLRVELELAETIGRLSAGGLSDGERQNLDERFKALVARKRALAAQS